ncbi:hypothetical protein BN891_14710 [Bacteroides xylanisolvens SD CC 2a]|nr:hypothetical protein BN891_14710 [Bacteroides xylanisolvens SD CC 2a]
MACFHFVFLLVQKKKFLIEQKECHKRKYSLSVMKNHTTRLLQL